MVKTYQTFCPLFPGFYGTVFEYDGEENDIESYNEENGTDYDWDSFEWDYADYHQRKAKAFVNDLERELAHILPVKFTFEELRSPREYNFANDSINVSVKLDLKALIDLIKANKEEATKYFKERYTSYDGFWSFHSNDYKDWTTQKYILEEPAHRIGALLECLCSFHFTNDDIMYWADGENWIDFTPIEIKEETQS